MREFRELDGAKIVSDQPPVEGVIRGSVSTEIDSTLESRLDDRASENSIADSQVIDSPTDKARMDHPENEKPDGQDQQNSLPQDGATDSTGSQSPSAQSPSDQSAGSDQSTGSDGENDHAANEGGSSANEANQDQTNQKPPVTNSLDQLTAADKGDMPEILKVRGMKFMYPSGSKPLEGYTIKRGIGIGGFGEVYFALSDAGKEVALKRIQRNLDIELRGVRQCLNLKHINLISLWDIRTSDTGECWVVMEYVPGESLREAINKHPGGMPMDLLDYWFSATAAGVAYLHDRGIVHRDLKPGNIFEDEDAQVVKIGDYGLSKFISTSQRDNQTESVGTFHYMAPEIGKGVYGKEVDIYAMGIILHEMLTGRVPFDGESSQEIIMKHLTADPDVDQIPPLLRPVVKRALAKDPDQRYSSVEEMIADLDLKDIPRSLSKKAMELSRSQSRRIPPIEPLLINPASGNPASGNPAAGAGGNSQEPFYIGDEVQSGDIQFGELSVVVDAESVASAEPLLVETVEVVEEELYTTHQVSEEPIARAVKGGWSGFVGWWNNETISTPFKILIVGAVALFLIASAEFLLPLALALGLVYLIYFFLRMAFSNDKKPTELLDATVAPGRLLSRTQQADVIRNKLALRPWSDRLTELSGSLLFSAIACGIFGLLGLAVGGNLVDPDVSTWAFYGWIVVTSVIACWSILIMNKAWEHRKGDTMVRRFGMLSVGLLVGLVSFAYAEAIHLNWANQATMEMDIYISPFSPETLAPAGSPGLLGHLAFFAGLFVMLRWWKNAESFRRTRFNVIAIGLCLIWGVVVGQFFHFPQPWSMVVAVVIAASLLIASPWLHPDKRNELIYGTSVTGK